jgi:dipeptidyl aminopeptidase/acylaminoacyl peptidase
VCGCRFCALAAERSRIAWPTACTDTVVFTLSRFEEFPDLWVGDTTFKDMKKVSDANPQAANYLMGKSEMIEYVNADEKLRALLTRPENFDPAKEYPLMVYIYEELTAGLHAYNAPNVGTSINIPRYVSNGYVVLRPDIVYETGYPGQSAEKCVLPAVHTVLAMGFIDPKRIGIQGRGKRDVAPLFKKKSTASTTTQQEKQ